jgi:hypothetical protein
MNVRVWLVVAPVLAMLLVGCLGTLNSDPRAEEIAVVPEAELTLPLHDSHRHWLLRGESGWCGAHEVRFGGNPDDAGIAGVRVAVLRDEEAAIRAYARLTSPAYLYSILRDRMINLPRPVEYPEHLDGDEVAVTEYDVRLPLVLSPEITLIGQITTVRAGRAVFLIESIGVHPPQLVPAVRELVRAAYRLPPDEC